MFRYAFSFIYVCLCVTVCFTCTSFLPSPADNPYCDVEGSIILTHTGSENSSTGIVQICRYGVWIPICGQNWNDFEASLGCEQLGFVGEYHFCRSRCMDSLGCSVQLMTGTLVQATTVPTPPDISQLVLDSFPIVKCLGGSPSSLQDCIVSDQHCSLSTVAFVDCNCEDDGRISDNVCTHVATSCAYTKLITMLYAC